MTPIETLEEIRERQYRQRLVVNRLRREVYQQTDPTVTAGLLTQLREAEAELLRIEEQLAALAGAAGGRRAHALVIDTAKTAGLLGPETTGLAAEVNLRMAQVPTSICHLLDPERDPLVVCSVRNADPNRIRRLRVTSYVEGYSARAVDTVELEKQSEAHEFKQMPTFFRERLREATELTRATLHVTVEDLDGRMELHKTKHLWLLARNTVPLSILDPQTGQSRDMTPYLGAFVTPNAPRVMAFLREATEFHPERTLPGYQGNKNDEGIVARQIKALFDALKERSQLTYVNSVIEFSPAEEGTSTHQRVRLPRESLDERQANCIDGVVLFASLIEGISMNPALVIIPGHALVGWETWDKSEQWKYLDTVMIGTHTFEEACRAAEEQLATFASLPAPKSGVPRVRMRPLRELRASQQIMPME